MLNRTILLIVVTALLINMVSKNEAKKKRIRHGPKGMARNYSTNCQEFSKFARFNPYSVIYDTWFVFYYWAAHQPHQAYRFFIPTANQTKFLRKLFADEKVTIPVNWTARHVIMQDRENYTYLLVERGDRGQYWSYVFARVKKTPIRPHDIRLRQQDNGRLLGLMFCKSERLYLMSRITEIPRQKNIQDEAARFGFRARRGKSYLYSGHEWMPIPEEDENYYFSTIVPEIINSTKQSGAEDDLSKLQIPDSSAESQNNCQLKAHSQNSAQSENTYPISDFIESQSIENDNIIDEKQSSTKEDVESTTQSITVPEISKSVTQEDTSYNERKVSEFEKDLKDLETTKDIEIPLSNKEFVEHQCNNDSNIPSTNVKQESLSTNNHREPQAPLEQKSLQSIDDDQEITDEIRRNYENIKVSTHIGYLKPKENQILIGHESGELNNEDKTNIPIPAKKNLPPQCYEMELVEESIKTSPANLPVILKQIEKSVGSDLSPENRKIYDPFTEPTAINLQL